MKYYIRKFWRQVVNFCYYGWMLRDTVYYDYNQYYNILQVVHNKFLKEFKNIPIEFMHGDYNKTIKDMLTVKVLLDRIVKDDYYTIYKDKHDTELKYMWDNVIETKLSNGNICMTFPNIKNKWIHKHDKVVDNLRKHDKDLLFKILKTKINSWWW